MNPDQLIPRTPNTGFALDVRVPDRLMESLDRFSAALSDFGVYFCVGACCLGACLVLSRLLAKKG